MDRRSRFLARAFTNARRTSLVVAVVATLAASLVGSAAPALAKQAPPAITPAGVPITSAGPLTRVEISTDLNCAVDHTGDTSPEFYGDTACGTLVAVGGTLYGPASIPAGGSASPRTPYTPVSQSAVTGAGTNANPYKVVTVVDLGSTGLEITQTDSYVVGQETYRTDVVIANSAGSAASTILYRAGDCYLQNSDQGFGAADAASGSVSCVAGVDDGNGGIIPGSRIEQWYPLSAGSSYYEDGYSVVWAHIGTQAAFADDCAQCANYIDNGAGLSWNVNVPAHGSATRSNLTVFSPLGTVPLTTTKTAAQSSVAAGASDSYTITVTNTNAATAALSSITDTLPAGFSYTAGSTTGATTADPGVVGQVLTWNGSFSVPGSGSLSLTFGVTASTTPGTYTNTATASAEGQFTVVGTGPTAPVTVTGDETAQLTLTKAVDNTGGGTAAATDWTLAATGPTSISGHTGDASITDATVNAGTYSLGESGGPSGYSPSAWSCTGGTLTGSSLVLAAGDTASCGITNTFVPVTGEPTLSINDIQGIEGDSGLRDFVFTVSRDGDTSGSASVHYHTRDGKAIAGQDYVSIPDATLDFAPGEASKDLVVQVVGDGKRANNEAFFVILSQPVGATIEDGRGRATILRDDPYLKIRNAHVAEPSSGLVLVRFKVVLSFPTISDVTVNFATRDGTALAGQDYVARSGTLTFHPGHSIEYVRVWVMADATQTANENFFVDLSGAMGPGGLLRIQRGTAHAIITD